MSPFGQVGRTGKSVGAGQLDQLVRIQSSTPTQDAFGEPDLAWSTVVTRWAKIEPLDGSEGFQARQVDATLSHKLTLWWDEDVDAMTPKYRIVHNDSTGRIFDIDSIRNVDERGFVLEVMATERV